MSRGARIWYIEIARRGVLGAFGDGVTGYVLFSSATISSRVRYCWDFY